jgi:hypothetical protein
MNNQDDILDQAEEIYLTEDQFIYWITSDTPRADCFEVKGEQLALKDMDPLYVAPPAPQYDLHQLVERAFSKPLDYWKRNVNSIHTPRPEIRKLERPCDAVWTMFRHSGLVIGVNDDGTVVARDQLIERAHEFRVTTDGDFYCDGKEQDDADLAISTTIRRVAAIRDAVRLWVKSVKGRKTPQGFGRLWRRVSKAAEVNFRQSSTHLLRASHPEQPLISFLPDPGCPGTTLWSEGPSK